MRHSIQSVLVVAALSTSVFSQTTPDADRFDKVIARYHALLLRQPKKGTAFDLLYRQYLDAGRLEELVERYQKLAKDEADNAAAHLVLAMLYERRGREGDALGAYAKAAQLDQKAFHAAYYRGLLLAELHRDKEAITALRAALKLMPPRGELLEIHKRLGRLYLRQNQTEEALEVWTELTELFPDDRFVLEELAALLAEEEQFEEALKRYEQLAKLAESDPYKKLMARVEIGQIQVRQGKLKTAIVTFDESLSTVDPSSWLSRDIRKRIEEIFLRNEDLEGLITYYTERLKNHPDDLNTMIRLAAANARAGDIRRRLRETRYRPAVGVPELDNGRLALAAVRNRQHPVAGGREERSDDVGVGTVEDREFLPARVPDPRFPVVASSDDPIA